MEGVVGTISEGGWNNFVSDEADFMAQLLGNCSIPNHDHVPINASNFSVFWPSHESNNSNNVNVGVDESTWDHDHEYLMNGQDVSNDSTMVSDDHHKLSEDVFQEKINLHQLGKRREKSIQEVPLMIKEDKSSSVSEKYSRKRPRIPTGEFQRSKRSMKLKCPKVDDDDNNNNNNNKNSGCCSEDDSNVSHEQNGVTNSTSSSKAKTRATRGSATDPQSLYARKRRERINERLRILQSLVPNGTKVDISTMLEEAVQYVKFLQLQIKLLSSDDTWMYAPLAYNGMDLGLDLNISIPKSQS
ncbi:hypothetical protein DH2020_023984 [Rehmannia glutinosa]|uniref:BHLH domain-containing protein n=1 Tax=Rehmannia glutinosa TaxID=99300 RepID=A0ABR0WA33_REHGL